MEQVTLTYCDEEFSPEWDAFVDSSNGGICQTSLWAAYKKTSGWLSFRFYIKKGNDIIAGCQISIITIRFLGKIGYIQLGACIKEKTPEIINLVIAEIKKFAHKNKLLYICIAPNHTDIDIISYLESEKFTPQKDGFPPDLKIKATLLLDLTPSVDDILSQMKSSKRKHIRKGLKNDILFREGTREDLSVFFDLSVFTAKKYSSDPPFKTLEDLYYIWDLLSPNKWIHLHLGIVEGKVICADISYSIGNTFQATNWGWNNEYGNYNITEVFHWKLIQWAKEKGYKYFDFVQVDMKSVKVILSNENDDSIKSGKFYGPTLFKMQFGGSVVEYPKVYNYFPGKFKQFLLHRIIGNIMGWIDLNSIIGLIYRVFSKSK